MAFNITELSGEKIDALIAALEAIAPGLVTTSQAGKLAPNEECIENGFIKLATSLNKGLMSKQFAEMLENPEMLVFTAGKGLTQNAGFHNSIYRGKNLGNIITVEQYAAISAGTFDDLFIGDYWTMEGFTWRIAALDYWYNTGYPANNNICTEHHVVIVPDSPLAYGKMHDTTNLTDGYAGSDFRTGKNSNSAKVTINNILENIFGTHVLEHEERLSTTVSGGLVTGTDWCSSRFELMTEMMVYGCRIHTKVNAGLAAQSSCDMTFDQCQLPLFRHDKSAMIVEEHNYWWLRDFASANEFCVVGPSGEASLTGMTFAVPGFRPAFGIKG